MTDAQPKKSDLGVRVFSAIVMVAVAAMALWLGGWAWTLFVAAVGIGVLWEWWELVRGFVRSTIGRAAWLLGGLFYVGLAAAMLILMREGDPGLKFMLMIMLGVVGTDIGAYFTGRTFGGPKIAPKISPSKTWSGLLGGVIGASIMSAIAFQSWESSWCRLFFPRTEIFGFDGPCSGPVAAPIREVFIQYVIVGSIIAVVAQGGDFFESWMKRRAGAKDSGKLIPGHGGLFDRVDGLLAVLFMFGLVWTFVEVRHV